MRITRDLHRAIASFLPRVLTPLSRASARRTCAGGTELGARVLNDYAEHPTVQNENPSWWRERIQVPAGVQFDSQFLRVPVEEAGRVQDAGGGGENLDCFPSFFL